MPTLHEIDRELARRDFHYFLKWSRPDWNWDWPHIVALAEKVQQTMDGEAKPWLLAEIGPQYGKTQLMTVGLCVWLLLRYPGIRIAICSYSQDSADRMSYDARQLAESIGIKFASNRNAVREWMIEGGGKVRAVGVGASLTGFPVDVALVDDLIKDYAESVSASVREGIKTWITTVLRTRRPQKGFVTGTPWHEDGPQTFFRNKYGSIFHELVLPSFAEENDPLGREPGEVLCEERWPRETLELEQSADPHNFQALHQCKPTPRAGVMFKVANFGFCDRKDVPPNLRTIIRWDFGYSDGKGDYSVGVVMCGPDVSGRFYIVEVVRGQWGPQELDKQVLALAQRWGPTVTSVVPQDGGSGKHVVAAMYRLLAGYPIQYVVEARQGGKEVRAMPYASQVNVGNVVLVRGPWNVDFVEEHRQFPNGKHDDQVDPAAGALTLLAVPVSRGAVA